jgi:hypothetical protein
MLGLSVVLFDSDLRLEVLLHEQQGVRQIGTATVSEIVSKPTQATTPLFGSTARQLAHGTPTHRSSSL